MSPSFSLQRAIRTVSTSSRALYHYQPMIKFVYSHDSPLEIIDAKAEESHVHPCSGSANLFPSSGECLSVPEWQSKFFKPFIVAKYTSPVKKPNSPVASTKSSVSTTTSFKFDRPLKENELASLSDLPKQLQFKKLEDKEIELINGGGIMI